MSKHPLKELLGNIFNRNAEMRKSFYSLLDIYLLRSWHIHRELKKWKKSAPKNAHILEVGSGFGQNIRFLSRIGKTWNIVGMDINANQVSDCNKFCIATGKHNVLFKVGSVEDMTDHNAFDLLLNVDLMEHIEHDQQAFINMYNALRTDGTLLLTTPIEQTVFHYNPETRFRNGYELPELKEKLKKAGFHHIKLHYSYSVAGRLSQNLSLKWPLALIRFSQFLFFLLIPYYLLILPFVIVLNYIDTYKPHRHGKGIVVKATK